MKQNEFEEYMKKYHVGRENAITSAETYALFYGVEALKNDSGIKKYNNLEKIKNVRRAINKTGKIHIVYDRLAEGTYIFYVAKDMQDYMHYKDKFDKQINGMNNTLRHCEENLVQERVAIFA